jgi:gamma-glutamyltranspeptidase / glutathione hydrolase
MSWDAEGKTGWKADSRAGVVAAGGAAAVAAGLGALERGGNAADAAVATLLALMVTDHGECSIGGEVPLMIYEARSGTVKVLSGQGGAPLAPDAIAWDMEHGIPAAGDVKIAPVPAVVDLCTTTLKLFGTQRFADAVGPTLRLLDAGREPWHPDLARTLRRLVDTEARTPGGRQQRLQAACDRFYGRGGGSDIADELESFYIEEGGFLRKADLAAHVTRVEEPVTVSYRGYTVCKCGPWTQGPCLCQALRLLEGFDVQAMGPSSADTVHAAVEALKLAMADRDAYYGDPLYTEVPLAALLSDAYTTVRRPLLDLQRASAGCRPGDPYGLRPLGTSTHHGPGPGGTTTCVVADRWGNVVAATPSANVHRPTARGGRAGVTFGNRLRSLNTTPGHPNCIQPGKRPRITLTPTLVLHGNRPAYAISVAGGDLQDQVTLGLLLNAIDFGMEPEQAVTAPRFATSLHEDSFDPRPDRRQTVLPARLTVSDQLPAQARAELVRRGHQVEEKAGPIGVPVMIHVDAASGWLRAAGDPAAGRHAAGLPQ